MSIVVGYLPTPAGRAALRASIDEATLRSSKLVIVQAPAPKQRFGRSAEPESPAASAEDQELLAESGVEHELVSVHPDSDPADAILDACERVTAELLVIGTRKRTPVGKLIMAPTTQRLLLEATCPVLCVKAGYTVDD